MLPAIFFGVFFVYPLVRMLQEGFARNDGDSAWIASMLSDSALLGVIWFTFWQAALSTALTVLVALPGASLLARSEFRGRRVLQGLVTVPFVLPTVVVATAFWGLLGPTSWLADVSGWHVSRGLALILVAHVFFNYSAVVRVVGDYWSRLDSAVDEAAAMLGASPLRRFCWSTWPRLLPAIAAAASLVFLFTFTSFGVVLLLGAVSTSTIEVEIHRQILFLFDLPTASVLALVQLVFVLVVLGVQTSLERRLIATQATPAPQRRNKPSRWWLVPNLLFMFLLVALPLLSLVERSFATASGYGLDFYRALSESGRGSTLFVAPLEAIMNSLRSAAIATVIALVLGMAVSAGLVDLRARTRSWTQTLMLLPLGTSAVTLGFGMLIALDQPPFDFRGEWWLVPVAQALVASPFVVRILLPVWTGVRLRLASAAAVLGASPMQTFRHVELPLISRALVIAAGFSFAISLGEFGATVFLARSTNPTVPVAIFRFLSRPGELNSGRALALSSILMLLVIVAITLIDRFRFGGSTDV